MVVFKESLEKTGTLPEHTDGFVDLLEPSKAWRYPSFSVSCRNRILKLSMRSKGRFNVERIAKDLAEAAISMRQPVGLKGCIGCQASCPR